MKPYLIRYVPSAAKAIRKLDKQVARRLLRAIDALASEPRPHGSIQLKGGEGEFRIREGPYRIIYEVLEEEIVVLVLKIGHRRDVYQ